MIDVLPPVTIRQNENADIRRPFLPSVGGDGCLFFCCRYHPHKPSDNHTLSRYLCHSQHGILHTFRDKRARCCSSNVFPEGAKEEEETTKGQEIVQKAILRYPHQEEEEEEEEETREPTTGSKGLPA